MCAFEYPRRPLVRRHGPCGYADVCSYRPWLRDEFCFRCAYCLFREQWAMVRANFDIDHFQPVALRSDLFLAYDNLVYSCATCNAAKGARLLPNPETTLVRDCIQVEEDGRLVCRTPEARRLVRMLGLNDVEFVEFRMLWLGIVALAKEHDPALWRRLMGYPIDLPDLEALRPPGGNVRPEGVRESSFALKLRGELPEVY